MEDDVTRRLSRWGGGVLGRLTQDAIDEIVMLRAALDAERELSDRLYNDLVEAVNEIDLGPILATSVWPSLAEWRTRRGA